MSVTSRVLENPHVYGLWQAPFAEQKLRPFLRFADLGSVRSVLDVGCGPGTNAPAFASVDYLGVDINPAYIETARRRYGRSFMVADVTKDQLPSRQRYQMIFANSLMHHIDDTGVRRLLASIRGIMSDDGEVHVLDLIRPSQLSVARFLAWADRGEHARPLECWKALFSEYFEPIRIEPYTVGIPGVPLWHMVYFVGRRPR